MQNAECRVRKMQQTSCASGTVDARIRNPGQIVGFEIGEVAPLTLSPPSTVRNVA
jgi:hypothetical protein